MANMYFMSAVRTYYPGPPTKISGEIVRVFGGKYVFLAYFRRTHVTP